MRLEQRRRREQGDNLFNYLSTELILSLSERIAVLRNDERDGWLSSGLWFAIDFIPMNHELSNTACYYVLAL